MKEPRTFLNTMKFFAAALALTSTFYAPVSGQCDGEQEAETITIMDIFSSQVVTNELHLGGELRYNNIGLFQNQPLDLVVTSDDYADYDIGQIWQDDGKGILNGKEDDEGKFGRINLQTVKGEPKSGEGNFNFCIVKEGTNEPIELDEFYWTTYDTDERGDDATKGGIGIKEKLIIDTSQTAGFQLVKGTEVRLVCEDGSAYEDNECAGQRTVFLSSTAGTGSDNPTDPNALSELQKTRSISFKFKNTACWDFTYDHYCPADQPDYEGSETKCRWYGGGNFLFAGESTELKEEGECFTNAPTMAPTKEPVECPEDVEIVQINGVTGVDINHAVRILEQDGSTVTVRLFNEWTNSPNVIDSIFYNYKQDNFDEECYEEKDVEGGDDYQDITIQCHQHKAFAELDICVADSNGALDEDGDDAEVPECCHPDLPENSPVVCYKIVVNCETQCPESASRALRGAM